MIGRLGCWYMLKNIEIPIEDFTLQPLLCRFCFLTGFYFCFHKFRTCLNIIVSSKYIILAILIYSNENLNL